MPIEKMVDKKRRFWDVKPCKYCGALPPEGHWRPYTWMYKHQQSCSKKPIKDSLKKVN